MATRPEGETWELIDGLFVMQATPTIPHSVIASNIERLLNDAVVNCRPDLIACREVTIVMEAAGIVGGGNYVPDVAILDETHLREGVTSTETCHLAAEVVSPSDRKPLAGSDRPKIKIKLEGYKNLPSCKAILAVDQSELRVILLVRTGRGWIEWQYESPDDEIAVPDFGLKCTVADIYARTPALRNAAASEHRP
ncbi:Uma2 family endonuclease [Jiella avicenniae]|uniref:Uma2 family endonuclease n=1 Tax=Jiella avicenniae TaxID=2907202 RepID=A0A9X1T5L1_9HYPH|nr:Uma2 family endonuclease [Jiella avicenniae]